LENNLSMEEVLAILKAMRDKDYSDKKFTAALQGVDLESEEVEEDHDITALRGTVAKDAGFGIGFGLGYVEENSGN
jgi:hypothetical protein